MNKRNQHEKGPPKRVHTKADGCRAKGMAGWMFMVHFFFFFEKNHYTEYEKFAIIIYAHTR